MKKWFVIVFLVVFSFPNVIVQAAALPPYLNITVNKSSGSSDGVFNFLVKGYNSIQYFDQSYSVATHAGRGSFAISTVTGFDDVYTITEDIVPGWSLTQASCVSDNSSVNTTIINNGVSIRARPYSDVVCNFTNAKSITKTPIVIVPGLLGTELYKGNDLLWANIDKMFYPIPNDSFMDPLQFKSDLTPLDNSVVKGGVLREATGNPSNILHFDYTKSLIDLLTSFGYVEGKDLFTFPYDWRYGVSPEVLEQFKGQMNYILTQTDSGIANGKVDIVAHSTGGLIVKKYVMDHQMDHGIGKAIFVGVPNLGAPKAYKTIINGDNFDVPGLEESEMKKIAQNVPVAYDLAPSREYVNQAGSFLEQTKLTPAGSGVYGQSKVDTTYTQATTRFKNKGLINGAALVRAENLHTSAFDTYDMRAAGVDLYSIVGCKSGTFGKFSEFEDLRGAVTYDFPRVTSGDSTVPFVSANSLAVDNNHRFFLPKSDHGKMLSSEGSKQLITNLLTGSNLDTHNTILDYQSVLSNPSQCSLNGHYITIKSPVSISVVDTAGKISGVTADGTIQNDIPGADYETWGEHKYVYIPDATGPYTITLKGEAVGSFTVEDQIITEDNIRSTQIFSNVPVTPFLTATMQLGTTSSMYLDNNSDGVIDRTMAPTKILPFSQALDHTAPVTVVTTSGIEGQPGWYRTPVRFKFAATDPSANGSGVAHSGVWKIFYKLDANAVYEQAKDPITVTTEGHHTLAYYSTDNLGNSEAPRTISFVIDRAPPEVVMKFNPLIKDLVFSATDALSPVDNVVVTDLDNLIKLRDEAGNITELWLAEKGRKRKLKTEIVKLEYNGEVQDTSMLILHFDWKYSGQGVLKELHQKVKAKKEFILEAGYNGFDTTLMGKGNEGKINKVLPGLALLAVTTNRGDFEWSY